MLRSAIVRLTRSTQNKKPLDPGGVEDHRSGAHDVIPISWIRLVRHLDSIVDRDATLKCLPFDEIIAIARSFDLASTETRNALAYFHRRGRIFFIGSNNSQSPDKATTNDSNDTNEYSSLRNIVVISMSWLVAVVDSVMHFVTGSTVREREIVAILAPDSPYSRQLELPLARGRLRERTSAG